MLLCDWSVQQSANTKTQKEKNVVRLWAAVSLGKHCATSQKTAAEETNYISGNNEYAINVVQNNTTVLDYDDNWNLLLYRGLPHQTPIAIT